MNTASIKARSKATVCVLSMAFLIGCTVKDDVAKVSTDVAALQKIVNLDATPRSAKWEIFGTPEYLGGVPGPSDFVTLIAELSPVDEQAIVEKEPAGTVWIAPESARPWLAEPFYSMLDKQKNTTVDLSTYPGCRSVNATLKQTGKPLKGFACSNAGKVLVYLTIADNSQS